MSDNLNISEPTADQLAAANAALAAGPQSPAPVVEAPAPVVEAPAQSAVPVVDEKVDFWANSWFSRNKQ